MDDFVREESFGWLVAVTSASMTAALDKRLRQHDLSIKHWPTLMCLWERDGVTQVELARMARVPQYTTTRTLDRLQERDLVERRPDPESRRAFRVYLTQRGRDLEMQLTPLATAVNAEHLESLQPDERSVLVKLMRVVVDDLRAR